MKSRKVKPRTVESREPSPVRQRLLVAGAELFASNSWEAVGVRTIIAAAGVNLSALNYHFGSKEGLLREIFSACAKPVVEARMSRLREMRQRPTPPVLEELLDAFIRPSLTETWGGNFSFQKLRARLGSAPSDLGRKILGNAFDDSCREYLAEIERALPDIPRPKIQWRFHFLLGSLLYTMLDSGRIQSITHDECDPGNVHSALQELIPFLAAGFRSPPTGQVQFMKPQKRQKNRHTRERE
jgi:AcrR family transcriptional regulator